MFVLGVITGVLVTFTVLIIISIIFGDNDLKK